MQVDTAHALDAAVGAEICPNCGAVLAGPYCQACGQKRFTRHDLTVAHFVYGQGRLTTAGKAVVIALCDILLFIAAIGVAAGIAIVPVLMH